MKTAVSTVHTAHLEAFAYWSILEVVMKLTRITKPPRSVQLRVTLAGELNAMLENYGRYYEHVHGDPVELRALIPEMLRAFIEPTASSCRGSAPKATLAHPASLPPLRPLPSLSSNRDCSVAAFVDALGAEPRT
jgi:hypothetical protein